VATLLVVGLVSVTFWGAFRSPPIWDDGPQTVDNPYVQSLRGLVRILSTDSWSATAVEEPGPFYRPVAMGSYLLNRLVGGNSAASYHAGNLVIHVLNALLLGVLSVRHAPARRSLAILAPVLLFAVAPINVEAVVYISARMDLLGTTCALAALVLNAAKHDPSRQGSDPGTGARVGAVLLVATALFCKESFIVTPALLFLQDAIVLRRSPRAEAGKYLGLAAAVAWMFVARWIVGVPSVSVAASTGLWGIVRGYAFLLATLGRALVYPAYLDPYRSYVPPTLAQTAVVLAVVTLVGAGAMAAVRRRPDDARLRELLFALAWISIALAPAALAIPNVDIVGERYAYFPFVGAFSALAPLADAAMPRTRLVAAVIAALLVACVWRSRVRVVDWASETTLYEATLRDDPKNPYALYGLGEQAALAGRFDSASALLARSLALNPESARALTALCYVHLNQGQPAVAEDDCARAIAIQPANARSWMNLAAARVNQGKWAAGLAAATRAIEMKPRSAEAHYLRAACMANQGALAGARDEVRAALEIAPAHPGANSLLRQLLARGIP
jgi:tetratricopeptide (TPR) repeat protein